MSENGLNDTSDNACEESNSGNDAKEKSLISSTKSEFFLKNKLSLGDENLLLNKAHVNAVDSNEDTKYSYAQIRSTIINENHEFDRNSETNTEELSNISHDGVRSEVHNIVDSEKSEDQQIPIKFDVNGYSSNSSDAEQNCLNNSSNFKNSVKISVNKLDGKIKEFTAASDSNSSEDNIIKTESVDVESIFSPANLSSISIENTVASGSSTKSFNINITRIDDLPKSSLKRPNSSPNTNGESPKKTKKSITFDKVSVYYFPRTQGFTCIPSEGGSTLGMSWNHSHSQSFTLEEAIEQRRNADKNFDFTPYSVDNWGDILGTSSEDSDSDELISDPEDSDNQDIASENFNCLQPLKPRDRRSILRASGVRRIDSSEQDECDLIRESREICGCSCQSYCDSETCSCAQAGISCQVDRINFPCSCTRDGCANPKGRIEFNPVRVRTHYIQTVMKLAIENRQDGGPENEYNLPELSPFFRTNNFFHFQYQNSLPSPPPAAYYQQQQYSSGATNNNSCFDFSYNQFFTQTTAVSYSTASTAVENSNSFSYEPLNSVSEEHTLLISEENNPQSICKNSADKFIENFSAAGSGLNPIETLFSNSISGSEEEECNPEKICESHTNDNSADELVVDFSATEDSNSNELFANSFSGSEEHDSQDSCKIRANNRNANNEETASGAVVNLNESLFPNSVSKCSAEHILQSDTNGDLLDESILTNNKSNVSVNEDRI